MSEADEVRLSDISEIGQLVPKGRYKCKLSAVNGKLSKAQVPAPMVEAVYDIVEGEQEGMTLNIYHSLKISQGAVKNGPNKGKPQYWAPGISDMKAACAAVGQPLPDVTFSKNPTVADAQKWALEYGNRLRPQTIGFVEIAVLEEPRKKKDESTGKWVTELDENGKPRLTTRAKVVGRWKTDGPIGLAAAGVTQMPYPDPLAGIGIG